MILKIFLKWQVMVSKIENWITDICYRVIRKRS